jgi:two-component system, response regulator PdtaR
MTAARMEIINNPTPAGFASAPSANHELPKCIATDDSAAAAHLAGDNVTDMTGRITRKMIDEAKSLLMSRQGMTEPEAHRWIQKTAMDRRTPKLAIATTIVETLGEKSSSAG